MSEQQPATTSACPHPEAVGTRWGDPISAERQAELQGYLDQWAAETDHGARKGPFDPTGRNDEERERLRLHGADVFWLAEWFREPLGFSPDLHLSGANLFQAHLEGAELDYVHLEYANLSWAYMEGATLYSTHLQRAYFGGAHLERADLREAHIEGANFGPAPFQEFTHLEGADLRGAWLDNKTVLNNVIIDKKTRLGDMQWSGVGSVNLTQIHWERARALGDEVGVRLRAPARQHEAAVRAYRQMATQLRAQGMSEVADRFAYRANVRQRSVFLRRFRIPQYLGSLFLDLISGYGYKPIRSLFAYILVILGFAATYFALGGANGQTLSWNEAIVISMTAFHGRGFFSTVFQPGDVQAAVAAVEAFIGLLIEIVLIATFTQRFFAR